jgi:hypothetical protein
MADDTAGRTRTKVVGLLADIVRWAGLAAALVLVIHVVLVAGEANPDNGIARFVRTVADAVSLGFKDLFNKPADDPKLRVLVNYGLAAIFWLTVSAILSRLLRRLG